MDALLAGLVDEGFELARERRRVESRGGSDRIDQVAANLLHILILAEYEIPPLSEAPTPKAQKAIDGIWDRCREDCSVALNDFGAKVASGCTAGNGLTGTAMGSLASLAATVTFFATAIAVSFLIEAVI